MEDRLGRTRKAPLGFSWLTLLFGFLVPLVRGHWTQALISLLLSGVTYGIYWLIYPFFVNYYYRKHLYNNGFRPIEIVGISEEEYEKRTGWRIVQSIDPREPVRPRPADSEVRAKPAASSEDKIGLKEFFGVILIVLFISYWTHLLAFQGKVNFWDWIFNGFSTEGLLSSNESETTYWFSK